jgi:UDP-N-acetylmuramyl pentapeptide phosphotransferase/UDP-N-acetylglucosamine-1-phosphate transferase
VDGELVRMPLHQFLLAKGISAVRIRVRRFWFWQLFLCALGVAVKKLFEHFV